MSEYKCKEGMIDNRMVKENHQQGIHRILQRGHNKMDSEGHNGKMTSHGDRAHWERKGSSLTPRKA